MPLINDLDLHFKNEGESTPEGLSISQGVANWYVRLKDSIGNIRTVVLPKKHEIILFSNIKTEYDEPYPSICTCPYAYAAGGRDHRSECPVSMKKELRRR